MKILYLVRTIILTGSLLLQLGTLCFLTHGAAGDVDLSFDPGSGVNGTVNAVAVQPDGKVIIGGEFTTVKGLVRTNLARLNADGSGDSSFTSGSMSYPVYSLALQPDGKVLVGSESINFGLTRVNSDGSPDTNFNANAYAAIASTEPYYPARICTIVVQPDGKVFYAGENLLRLNSDGTLDNGFTTGVPGFVYSMALQSDGKLIAAGYFFDSSYGLFRLNTNGSPDNSFTAPVTGIVRSIVLQPDGKVIFGGLLIRVNGTNLPPVARLDASGSVDATFGLVSGTGPGTDEGGLRAVVHTISLQSDGKVIIGGQFDSINGSMRKNLARLNADGSLDLSYPNGAGGVSGFSTSSPDTSVKVIVRQPDGQVFIGGAFTTVNGTNRNRTARLNADGSLDSSFHPGGGVQGSVIFTAVAPDGKVLVGGGRPGGNVSFAPIARINANGSPDTSFNPGAGPNSDIVAVALQPDGKLLIGGSFTSVNGTPRLALARLHANGGVDAGFDTPLAWVAPYEPIPPAYSGVYSTAVTAIQVQPDGRVLVAGHALTSFDADGFLVTTTRHYVFRFHANGDLDPSFSPVVGNAADGSANFFFDWYSYPPSALALQPDGKVVVGGYFDSINGTARNGLVRLNADGTMDASFIPATESPVSISVGALALQPDGKVLAGGSYFGVMNGVQTFGIARLNANGSRDATFDPGAGTGPASLVSSIALQADGKVLIAGKFSSFNGTNRRLLARLNANGSLDSAFDPGTSADGGISALALQPDGRVLIGGAFLTFNGVLRPYVARLYGDSATPSLNIARSNAVVIVSWPVTGLSFQLQETTNPSLPNSWSPVAQSVVTNAGQISVTVPASVGSKLFRLRSS
jgi:uncharacterized delta-60 repeat protein